jgi:chorismate mutase-like protein
VVGVAVVAAWSPAKSCRLLGIAGSAGVGFCVLIFHDVSDRDSIEKGLVVPIRFYPALLRLRTLEKATMTASSPHTQASELMKFREQIDAIDKELIDVLKRRFEVIRAVGAFKAREGIEVVQSDRAKFVIERAEKAAKDNGLDADFVRKLYEKMIEIAHEMEHEIVGQQK